MKEINKKICYACDSDNHEMKDCDSVKNTFIIDRASIQIKKEELKYRLEEYGKITYKDKKRQILKTRKYRNGVL